MEELTKFLLSDRNFAAFEGWAYSLWPFWYFPRHIFDSILTGLFCLFIAWVVWEWILDIKRWLQKRVKQTRLLFRSYLTRKKL